MSCERPKKSSNRSNSSLRVSQSRHATPLTGMPPPPRGFAGNLHLDAVESDPKRPSHKSSTIPTMMPNSTPEISQGKPSKQRAVHDSSLCPRMEPCPPEAKSPPSSDHRARDSVESDCWRDWADDLSSAAEAGEVPNSSTEVPIQEVHAVLRGTYSWVVGLLARVLFLYVPYARLSPPKPTN